MNKKNKVLRTTTIAMSAALTLNLLPGILPTGVSSMGISPGLLQVLAAETTIYVSAKGKPENTGTEKSPLDLYSAVEKAKKGQTIVLLDGTYALEKPVRISPDQSGSADGVITLQAQHTGKAILDASGLEEKSQSAVLLQGDYWTIKGILVTKSGDGVEGMTITGSYNRIWQCAFNKNGSTGLLISASGNVTKDQWPQGNQILSCISSGNVSQEKSGADGFTIRKVSGSDTLFQDCIAYQNSDDGFDFSPAKDQNQDAKVKMEHCLTYGNQGDGLLETDRLPIYQEQVVSVDASGDQILVDGQKASQDWFDQTDQTSIVPYIDENGVERQNLFEIREGARESASKAQESSSETAETTKTETTKSTEKLSSETKTTETKISEKVTSEIETSKTETSEKELSETETSEIGSSETERSEIQPSEIKTSETTPSDTESSQTKPSETEIPETKTESLETEDISTETAPEDTETETSSEEMTSTQETETTENQSAPPMEIEEQETTEEETSASVETELQQQESQEEETETTTALLKETETTQSLFITSVEPVTEQEKSSTAEDESLVNFKTAAFYSTTDEEETDEDGFIILDGDEDTDEDLLMDDTEEEDVSDGEDVVDESTEEDISDEEYYDDSDISYDDSEDMDTEDGEYYEDEGDLGDSEDVSDDEDDDTYYAEDYDEDTVETGDNQHMFEFTGLSILTASAILGLRKKSKKDEAQ